MRRDYSESIDLLTHESIDLLTHAIAILKKQDHDREQSSLARVSKLKAFRLNPAEGKKATDLIPDAGS